MRTSFYVLCISFFVGVAWRSLYVVGIVEVVAIMVVVVLVYGMSRIYGGPYGLYVVLAGVSCCLGLIRTETAFHTYEQARVYESDVIMVGTGIISAEPDVRDGFTVLWIDMREGESSRTVRMRAKVPTYPVYRYGDVVSFRGTLHIPRAFLTETGRMFDYAGFLMKDGVHYELRHPTLTREGRDAGNPVIAHLLFAKDAWLRAVSRAIPEPAASLAGGVIVGAKRSLGEHWLELFRVTGLIHIVVLSGYNLTLVANVIVRMCGRLPRIYAFLLGTLGVVAFALMVGGGATVVRASMMAILGMLATFLVRPYLVVRGLALAGAGMVAWNPFVLVFDAGFQLSFVATLGLILGSPLIAYYLTRIPAVFQLREIVAATLATQVAVLPLLLYHIGDVSLVAPLVNMLVLPVVPFAMLAGFLMGLIGIVSAVCAFPFAWMTYGFLSYTLFVVDALSRVPYASVAFPPVPWWFLLLLYVGIVWWWYRMKSVLPTCLNQSPA